MKNEFLEKLKESLFSVLPIVAIVLVLCCTPLVNLTGYEIGVFCFSAFLLILGMGLFSLGADLSMSPMGEQIGSGLTRSKSKGLLIAVCFAMGVLITIAEPDLSVLAEQIKNKVDPTALLITVGLGVGAFLVIGVLKTAFKASLNSILMVCYMLLFALAALLVESGNGDFLALSFDSGGVTTGPITAPFIMALGAGIAGTLGSKNHRDSSFGFVALCSIGPILMVAILGLTSSGNVSYIPPDYAISSNIVMAFLHRTWDTVKEVALSLGLIVAFFTILQITHLKLPKAKLLRMAVGMCYTFVGLVLFLTAVNVGFTPVGYKIGNQLAENPTVLVIAALVLGAVTVLAEPAVHVLNKQVEEITNKGISKKSMLIALSVGVGVSLALSMLRIVFDFSILYYLVPGYFISLALSLFVPKMYTAIAFDSGGVASGPLTSTFILPFAIGACVMSQGVDKILMDAFGIVAMVAMTPLITIQLLGFRSVMTKQLKSRIAQRKIISAEDDQIINFM
ncbi:MAG: DUF1538 domain-containing protein [Clostridia bacterium]|nr:DUF1538 domain-containing protein [Clostridia bacterium]